MTQREVEALALRSAMGETVCARLTRRVSDNSLVFLEESSRVRAPFAAAIVLSTTLIGGSALAQSEAGNPATPIAILTGRLLDKDGHPLEKGGGVVTLKQAGDVKYSALLHPDGTFEAHAAPGTYDVVVGGVLFGEKIQAATLHEGQQSVGDMRMRFIYDSTQTFFTGGEVVSILGHRYWIKHPMGYVRYLGYKVKRRFFS